ncbi:Gti1/Pac2 family domain-containing protein [Trichoderma austrokoningii]
MSNQPLMPTFEGHISTTMEALILFESCLHGRLAHVPRRPHDRERQDLISSGNVFLYEEHASGIKRWTDGISWSPSRILGNFLIYRELEKPFPPGEKKRALKKKKHSSNGGINRPERSNSNSNNHSAAAYAAVNNMGPGSVTDPERSLVGSLVDSYPFKKDGLIKKTISITYQGVPHHMVSYYTCEDVLKGRLVTPSACTMFMDVRPRAELLLSQNFRNPLDEAAIFTHEEGGGGLLSMSAYYPMPQAPPVHDLSPHGIVMSQSMAVSQPLASYSAALDYNDFFAAQQQQQQQQQASQQQHHHHHHALLQHHAHHQQPSYHYPPQQQQHHHHHQLQLQQAAARQHEDHQREEYQRDDYQRDDYSHYHDIQQSLQSQHPSPQEQMAQEPQQQQQQPQQHQHQQPPSSGYVPQGGPWYDPSNQYFFD